MFHALAKLLEKNEPHGGIYAYAPKNMSIVPYFSFNPNCDGVRYGLRPSQLRFRPVLIVKRQRAAQTNFPLKNRRQRGAKRRGRHKLARSYPGYLFKFNSE